VINIIMWIRDTGSYNFSSLKSTCQHLLVACTSGVATTGAFQSAAAPTEDTAAAIPAT
jgi:hypothetical protein